MGRAEAPHGLQVDRQEDQAAEHSDAHDHREDDVRGEGPVLEEFQRNDRFLGFGLDQHEQRGEYDRGDEKPDAGQRTSSPWSGPAQLR